MAAVSTTANVIWTSLSTRHRQAFVSYAGRLFRMIYNNTTKVLAIAFADHSEPTKIESRRHSVRIMDIIILAVVNPANACEMQRFLDNSFGTFRAIGVL